MSQKLVEEHVGSKIVNSLDMNQGILHTFENGEDWLVYDDFDTAESDARQQVKQQLEDEPELFSQDWLSGFVDEQRAKEDIELTINNDSGYYEQFKEEKNPKTDEEYDEFSDWAEEKARQIIQDDDFEDSGFNKMDYIDIRQATVNAINTDGVAHFLSGYDGVEVELSDGSVMYRTN